MTNPVTIGDATLYLGDCLQILPTLGRVDAVISDPPYGISYSPGGGGGGIRSRNGNRYEKRFTGNDLVIGDDLPFEPRPFLEIAPVIVLWGANHYASRLPDSSCWLVWDKKNTMPSFGDCELAWTNIDRKSVKLLTYEYNGLIGKREDRVHPTQKPYEVMRWCIEKLPNGCETILDPFMGSGTTLVAAAKLGRRSIGIEIEPKYFDIACRRVEEAYRQADLFIPQPQPKATQEELL